MLSLFLSSDTSSTSSNQVVTYVLLAVVVVALVAMWIISSRRNKKRQQEADDLINAVKPGHKVKTIGGICGIVVEVNEEEKTFILETGSEAFGKSYIKFDKQAIYQTDAVVEKSDKKSDDKQTEEKAEEPFTDEQATSADSANATEAKDETVSSASAEEENK
jgi:preprotein translocase subunit YajC